MRALSLSLFAAVLFLSLEAGAQFVWVDADGRAISPFLDPETYVDDAGLFWPLDPETATVSDPAQTGGRWFFAEPGCTGPTYEWPVPAPRRIFRTFNCPVPRYRPDDVQSQLITIRSEFTIGIGCQDNAGIVRMVPYSQMIFVGPAPDPGAQPPLHLENRPAGGAPPAQ